MLKKFISFVFAFVLVVVLCTPGLASNMTKKIDVTYGISIYFNGEKQNLVDGAGNSVAPFVYNGTTYVPIRAISNLFGADILYDSENNSALIYDDYAEAYAVINRMSNVINDCFLLVAFELGGISPAKELEEYNEWYSECVEDIDKIYSILSSLAEDNRVIGEIVENVLPEFTDFAVSFAEVNKSYENLRKSNSSYYANKFVDAYHVAVDQHYAVEHAISYFYEKNCWRDIDQQFDEVGNGAADSTQQPGNQTPPQNTNTTVSQNPNSTQAYDRVVYVSYSGNVVHSIRNCSGMKYYRVMPISQARASGYQFCKNCW